jgi:hypothetical protein
MKTTFLTRFFCSSTLLYLACSMATGAAQAQSSCSSDQQPVPTALLERFISADCSDCWATSTLPIALKGQATLDWIVPSPRGDEAPLSAAATNDATARLQALQLPWATAQAKLQTSAVLSGPPEKPASTLRVAHGLPVNGYIGTSIEFKPSALLRQTALGPKKLSSPSDTLNVQAYVVLVESLPAGTEGSQVERHLVRNMLEINWNLGQQLSKAGQVGFKPLFESRPLSIPQGVNPDRLRVLGWVQSAKDIPPKGLPGYPVRVLAMAQSRCKS